MVYTTLREVRPGEELCISYGGWVGEGWVDVGGGGCEGEEEEDFLARLGL